MSKIQHLWQKLHKILAETKYTYNFSWLGFPIFQLPQDIQAMQEIIWKVKPDLIIETGVALGGSIIFSASMLYLLKTLVLLKGYPTVVGIEINLYPEVEKAIHDNPLYGIITILKGSSIDESIINKVKKIAKHKKRILVCLDSNHTHDHVLAELKSYAPLVSVGSYIVVNDTGIEDLPNILTHDRPWGKGNNPKTAVWEFLKENDNFEIDNEIDSKLIITGHPNGYLKRIK